jgi:hypothetical protein
MIADLVDRGLNPSVVSFRDALLYLEDKERLQEEQAAVMNYGFTGEK